MPMVIVTVLMVYLFGWECTEHESWLHIFCSEMLNFLCSAYFYNLLNFSKNINFGDPRALPHKTNIIFAMNLLRKT